MQSGDEENVRRIAYDLWEKEGRPHGRHDQHWHEARHEAKVLAPEARSAHTPAPEVPSAPAERAKPAKPKAAKQSKKKT